MKFQYPVWSEESINRLRELRDTGLTFEKIGKILGRTKNSVVGKAHRIGIFSTLETKKKHAMLRGQERLREHERKVSADIARRAAQEPPDAPMGLEHLGPSQCRYAVGGDKTVAGFHLFCARPINDETRPAARNKSQYCKRHEEIVWRTYPFVSDRQNRFR